LAGCAAAAAPPLATDVVGLSMLSIIHAFGAGACAAGAWAGEAAAAAVEPTTREADATSARTLLNDRIQFTPLIPRTLRVNPALGDATWPQKEHSPSSM
jgi:hypothetical protein